MGQLQVVMPKLSMTMEEGELVTWHKQRGDQVRSGEVLCEVLSDKVEMEVEAPDDGVVAELLAEEGATVAVGAPIATLTTESDDLLGGLLDEPPQTSASAQAVPATPATDTSATPSRGGIAVAPAARRRARELDVDLAEVAGTGPRGLIRVSDVEAAAARSAGDTATAAAPAPAGSPAAASAPPAAPAAPAAPSAPAPAAPSAPAPATPAAAAPRESSARQVAMRSAIARRMTPSAAVPQFTVFGELELERVGAQRGRVSWTALLLAASARALRQHPQLNASWQGDRVVPADALRVAIAVDTPNGLLAPVLDSPDLLSLPALDQALRALVDRARLGKLTPADQEPGTFTVSNLGPLGVGVFQALLTPPQAAALSVGSIGLRPVVRDGLVVARVGCQVGLTIDHRVADGADAARYLATLREQVENPTQLLEEI